MCIFKNSTIFNNTVPAGYTAGEKDVEMSLADMIAADLASEKDRIEAAAVAARLAVEQKRKTDFETRQRERCAELREFFKSGVPENMKTSTFSARAEELFSNPFFGEEEMVSLRSAIAADPTKFSWQVLGQYLDRHKDEVTAELFYTRFMALMPTERPLDFNKPEDSSVIWAAKAALMAVGVMLRDDPEKVRAFAALILARYPGMIGSYRPVLEMVKKTGVVKLASETLRTPSVYDAVAEKEEQSDSGVRHNSAQKKASKWAKNNAAAERVLNLMDNLDFSEKKIARRPKGSRVRGEKPSSPTSFGNKLASALSVTSNVNAQTTTIQ